MSSSSCPQTSPSPIHDQVTNKDHDLQSKCAHNRTLNGPFNQLEYEPCFLGFLPKNNGENTLKPHSEMGTTSNVYNFLGHPVNYSYNENGLNLSSILANRLEYLGKKSPVISSQGVCSRIFKSSYINNSPTKTEAICTCQKYLCSFKPNCQCGKIDCNKKTTLDNLFICNCNYCSNQTLNEHYFSTQAKTISGISPESQIDLNWSYLLKALPKISDDFIRKSLQRYPIKRAYIRIGKIIITFISFQKPDI